jgi:HK97 family phage major capsid protein
MKNMHSPYSRAQQNAFTDNTVLQRRKSIGHLLEKRDGGQTRLEFLPLFSRDASGDGFTRKNTRLLEDELAPHSNLIAAGASVISFDLASDTQLPAIDPGQFASWGTPNESDPTSTLTLLQPKRLVTKIVVSKMLLKQNAAIVIPFVERQLFSAIAAELERAALVGTGTDGQPLGITKDPNISLTLAAPTAANIAAAERGIAEDYLENDIAVMTSPQTRAKFRTAASASGPPVWTREMGQFVSPHLEGDCALVGSFSDLIIGLFGGIDLMADPYSQDALGFITLRAELFADVVALRPAAFNFIRPNP